MVLQHSDCRWLRTALYGFLLALILTLLVPSKVFAKLVVSNPEGALEGTSVIVVGTVQERHYTEDRRSVVIQIDEVVKGQMSLQQLSWQMAKPIMYGWLDFDFPEPGSQVLLLLRGNDEQGYELAWDLNSVAMFKDGQVTEIYHGSSINESRPEQYAAAYDAYYQAHRVQVEVKPSTFAPARSQTDFWTWLWDCLHRLSLPFIPR